MQPGDSQDPRYVKSWFCGCAPPPKGDPLPQATENGEASEGRDG